MTDISHAEMIAAVNRAIYRLQRDIEDGEPVVMVGLELIVSDLRAVLDLLKRDGDATMTDISQAEMIAAQRRILATLLWLPMENDRREDIPEARAILAHLERTQPADTQADLTERARALSQWLHDLWARSESAPHLTVKEGARHIKLALQSEREAAAAEARRAAIEECAQTSVEYISSPDLCGCSQGIADAILRLASAPAPQIIRDSAGFPVMGSPPTLPCYCDETQCYSADMQPGWHCKKQAQVASPLTPQEEPR